MTTNKEQLIQSFETKIGELNSINNKKQKLQDFFKTEKLSVVIDGADTPLNSLYIMGSHISIHVDAHHQQTHSEVAEALKANDNPLKDYYDFISENLAKHSQNWATRQSARKDALGISATISGHIAKISENFKVLDDLYIQSMNSYKACIEVVNNPEALSTEMRILHPAIVYGCEYSTLPTIVLDVAKFSEVLFVTRDIAAQALSAYFIARHEYSTAFKKQLITTAHLKSLQDFNDEVIRDFEGTSRVIKLSPTFKTQAKEIFEGLVALQNNMVDIANSYEANTVKEESQSPALGDFKFKLPYDSYSEQLGDYATKTFKNQITAITGLESFAEANISLDSIKEYLSVGLSVYCNGLTEEDAMYCGFVSALSELSGASDHDASSTQAHEDL